MQAVTPTELTFPHFVQSTSPRRGRKRFRLVENYGFETPCKGRYVLGDKYLLYPSGWLLVLAGYWWDLGTIAIDDPSMLVASLEHDVFCDMVNAGQLARSLRPAIDAHFRWRLQEYSRSWLGRSWSWVRWAVVRCVERVTR